MYIDFHTHRRLSPENSVEIISVHPEKQIPGDWFTIGYHPWWTGHILDEAQINVLKRFSEKKGFLAIGECGLDRLKGPKLEIQMDIFTQQIELANLLQCPLIIHCVRAFNEVVSLKKQIGTTPWVIHGFVRNKILAKQLLDHDIFLSVAPHSKMAGSFRETLLFLPADKMFLETDSEYSLTIAQRYQIFADIRGIREEDLQHQLLNNFCTFFSWKKKHIAGWLERSELLIGTESLALLQQSHVLLVGLGGVGSFAGEFLVRAGIGQLTIIDGDVVDPTNKNRQLQALDSTTGMSKVALLEKRYLDINPDIKLRCIDHFMEPNDMETLLRSNHYDFIMDCIDSVQPKLNLITLARASKMKFISSMGAGGKLDPTAIRIADISQTKECKFARTVKKHLKRRGVRDRVLVVYSEEIQPKDALKMTDGTKYKRSYYGTISYMPALFGLFMASEVIRRLGKLKKKKLH